MPRLPSGAYELPAGNPVVNGTVITSNWANTTLSDMASALSTSVVADGTVPFSGALKLASGAVNTPSLTFNVETTTGLYRPGLNTLALTVGAANQIVVTTTSSTFSGNINGTNETLSGTLTANNTTITNTVSTATVSVSGHITSTGNLVSNVGTVSNRFNTIHANTFSGTSAVALYADLAEKYVADSNYPAGTVVSLGGDKEVTASPVDSDTAVVGVVSTQPAFIMNSECTGKHVVTVALTGRVPCLVLGPVKKGDMLVSAGLGLARVNNNPAVGTLIGKSVEDFDGGYGTVEIVVGK